MEILSEAANRKTESGKSFCLLPFPPAHLSSGAQPPPPPLLAFSKSLLLMSWTPPAAASKHPACNSPECHWIQKPASSVFGHLRCWLPVQDGKSIKGSCRKSLLAPLPPPPPPYPQSLCRLPSLNCKCHHHEGSS